MIIRLAFAPLMLAGCALPEGAQPNYPANTARDHSLAPGGGNKVVGRAVADELTK